MVGLTVNELQDRIIELERMLDQRRKLVTETAERCAELQAEVNVLLERNTALQHEVTTEQRRNLILEQRLRRVGDAMFEGECVVDGQ